MPSLNWDQIPNETLLTTAQGEQARVVARELPRATCQSVNTGPCVG
jgi:hypothetical protein